MSNISNHPRRRFHLLIHMSLLKLHFFFHSIKSNAIVSLTSSAWIPWLYFSLGPCWKNPSFVSCGQWENAFLFSRYQINSTRECLLLYDHTYVSIVICIVALNFKEVLGVHTIVTSFRFFLTLPVYVLVRSRRWIKGVGDVQCWHSLDLFTLSSSSQLKRSNDLTWFKHTGQL